MEYKKETDYVICDPRHDLIMKHLHDEENGTDDDDDEKRTDGDKTKLEGKGK